MKRLSLVLLVVLLADGCDRWSTRQVPLQFSRKWVTGEAEVARPDANGIPVTIRLRLSDADAFGKEFQIREPFVLPCQRVRLIYRNTPQSAPQVLQTKWSHAGHLWSEDPELCFHSSVEWVWRVLIARERGELPLDVDGRLVLISGEKRASTEEIAIVVLRQPRSREDFIQQADGDEVDRFVLTRSQWLPLTGQ